MKHGLITGGTPTKRVPVFEISDADTDEAIMDFATISAGEVWKIGPNGENCGTLYGRTIRRSDDGASAFVTLHID